MLLPLLLLMAGFLSSPVPAEPAVTGARPNVVFFFIDTLRADRLHCYGHTRPTSPSLDRLAARGVLFERAMSQAAWSLPSYATIFTSLYPPAHGVMAPTQRLPPATRTLAGILSACGYRTAAFPGGGHLMPAFGLNAGFQVYRSTGGGVSLSYTVPSAVRWLDEEAGTGPFFLLVHGYDVHSPYSAPLGFSELYDPAYRGLVHQPGFLQPDVLDNIHGNTCDSSRLAPFEPSCLNHVFTPPRQRAVLPPFDPERPWRESGGPASLSPAAGEETVLPGAIAMGPGGLPFLPPQCRLPLSAADLEHLRAHYDGALTYADTWLGLFFEALEARGLARNTIVFVAGDHGEELGEHGRFSHGLELRDSLLHVPLVACGPGLAAGRRVGQLVELADLAPSVLELCSIPASRRHQGRSLVPLLRPGAPPVEDPERAAFSFDIGKLSIRTQRWRMVWSQASAGQPTGTLQLFDLPADPDEQRDVSSREPRTVEALRSRLLDLSENLAVSSGAGKATFTSEEHRFIRLFGYW